MSSKLQVVVVGGGGSGAMIARTLSQQLDSTKHHILLFEQREYYLHYPGTLRMLVSDKDKLEDKTLMPYDNLFANKNGEIIRSNVTSIVPNENKVGGKVLTSDGAEHEYNVLVIATGSSFEGPLDFPLTKADTLEHVASWREKFSKSKNVVIVGGGAVGCELAGEIRDIYPDTQVTVVHKDTAPLQSVYPDRYRRDVESRWRERNIKMVFSEQISEIPAFPADGVTSDKGTKFEADLIVPTRGGRPNTEILRSLSENVISSSGHVIVEKTLQVKGFKDIFAAGDIIEWKEVKQVAKYPGHCTTITANVKSVLEGKPPAAAYKSMFEVLALTNGSGGGAMFMGVLWGLRFGNGFTKMIKAKDLFITKTAQSIGVPAS